MDHHSGSGSTDGWRCMERPLVCMISRMIRAKASVPHDIIRPELAASPIVVEALTKSVSFIHSIWDLPSHRYARLALESSRQLALQGDTTCWYGHMTSWFLVTWIQYGYIASFPVLCGCTLSVSYEHRDD